MAKAAEWSARVAAWQASGLRAAEFCKGKDYSPKGLQWWSSHLRRASGRARKPVQAAPRLARVMRAAKAMPERPNKSLVVEVDGARVEVPVGADLALLAVVFNALRAHRAEARR